MSATPTAAAAADARAPGATASPRLGLALAVIATAQLMLLLDANIVNVALPKIQDALHFSGSNLEWVVNAYTLAFGGLLLLGGRAGDLLGRRQVFVAGILVFTAASLIGGFATNEAWLLTARAVQGGAAAFAAPTALSLIAVTFPEGPQRNRAMAVYTAMTVAGGAVGLVAGGLLVVYANWRWVLFVNVPIGLVVAGLATRVLGGAERRPGRFDLPGAVTGSLGIAALVYGLSNAATGVDGTSHVGDAKVVVSLGAAVVLLAAFVIVEARSEHALMPFRVLRNRDRSGAYLTMLCVSTAMFGLFFFLTIFMQDMWGYSALKTGLAYLPMVVFMVVVSGVAAQLVPKAGARPLMIIGAAITAGGMFWLSRISEHSTYLNGVFGPMMVTAAGVALIFMPVSLLALVKVPDHDSGVASSLLNVGQQVGGAVGLAILSSVAWSAVAGNMRSHAAQAAASPAAQAAAADHAMAYGFSRGFIVSAGVALLALVISAVMIRVKPEDLAGINPMAAPTD